MASLKREWGEPFLELELLESMKNLNLTKPLAIIDLETTGLSIDSDRIVEISVLVLRPDGSRDHCPPPQECIARDKSAVRHRRRRRVDPCLYRTHQSN